MAITRIVRASRRACLSLHPLEHRTVPTAGIVQVTATNDSLALLDNVGGGTDDITITEIGPKQFQVTGNNGTQLVNRNGQPLANPVSFTLTGRPEILGVFGFNNGTSGPSDDHVSIVGSGQTFVQSIQLLMWGGTDSVSINGLQASTTDITFGSGDSRLPDSGRDTLQIDSSFISSLSVKALGSKGLDMNLSHYLGGQPSKPSAAWGVSVKSLGQSGDTINLSSFAIFGAVHIDSSSGGTLTVDGSNGTSAQGLISNGLQINAYPYQPTQINVANVSVGGVTVGWGPTQSPQASASAVAIANVDSSGPLTVDTLTDRRNFAFPTYKTPTNLTVTGTSASVFTFKPNDLPSSVDLDGCAFSSMNLVGGTATDNFTINHCSVDINATIDTSGGTGNVQIANSYFGGTVQLGAGTVDDIFNVTGCSFGTLQYDGDNGTNTFRMTSSSVDGLLKLLGGAGWDDMTLDGITVGNLNYSGRAGTNQFTLKGHSRISGNATLTGGAGDDRLEIEQTDIGSTAPGKAGGGNLKINIGTGSGDQVLLGYNVLTTADSDANHILGALTIMGKQGLVEMYSTNVRGATLISMSDEHGSDQLYVDYCTFRGRFTYATHGAGTFVELGEYANGSTTTFFGGVDLSAVTGASVINLATAGPSSDQSGPVFVYGMFAYKLALHVGINFHYYRF